MNFKEIFELLINRYGDGGLVITILIIILFLFLPYLFNKSNKNMSQNLEKMTQELTNNLATQNKDLIEDLRQTEDKLLNNQIHMFDTIVNKRNTEHSEGLNTRDAISTPIQNKINHLKDYYGCSRVSVVEFHNSISNLNGLPFKWYDLIYESIAKGIHSISIETKNMPFNILTPIISEVSEGEIAIFNEDNVQSFYNQSSVLYDFCVNRFNIHELVCAPLMNKDNKLIGLLTLEYSYDNVVELSELSLDELELEAHAISTLLEL